MLIKMQVNNVKDVQVNGKWIKSWVESELGNKTQFNTRASICYRGMMVRCNPLDKTGSLSSYEGCSSLFRDFQEFTEWCQTQYGYMYREENGKFWQLDKDLYSIGNRLYSPETCLFVPQRINCLFTNQRQKKYDLPLGIIYKVKTDVMTKERSRPYESRCNNSKGRQLSGGFYADPIEAHFSYLTMKIKVVEGIIMEGDFADHKKLLGFLECRIDNLKQHLNNKIQLLDF